MVGKRMFSKTLTFAIKALLDVFWRPSRLILRRFESQHGGPKFNRQLSKTLSNLQLLFGPASGPFWELFLGGQKLSKRLDQTWDEKWNLLLQHLRGPAIAKSGKTKMVRKGRLLGI